MPFYDVRGVLVRRVADKRGVHLEAWDGDAWTPFLDVEAVLRHGVSVPEAQAAALLTKRQQQLGSSMTDAEARRVLRE